MWKYDYSHYYRRWHNTSTEHTAGMISYYHGLLRKWLPIDTNAPALDLGAGFGFVILALKELGFKKTKGIDIDRTMIREAANMGLDVEEVDNILAFLQQFPQRFALITAFDFIEHIPCQDQVDLIKAIYAALTPEGRLICTVPNANSILAGRYRYNDYTHTTSFTEASLEFLLYHGEFRHIQIIPVEPFHRPSHRLCWRREYWRWWLWKIFRCIRRLQMISELGFDEGTRVPLSLNIQGIATKE